MTKLKIFVLTLLATIGSYFIADEFRTEMNDYINDNVEDPDNILRWYNVSWAIFWVILCMVVVVILVILGGSKRYGRLITYFPFVWLAATLGIFLTSLFISPLVHDQSITINKDTLLDYFCESLRFSVATAFAAMYAIKKPKTN